jgi:DNA-binding NtrC family response regulator
MFSECASSVLTSPPTVCGFSDTRTELLEILNQKLAPRFQFEACDVADRSIARMAVLLLAIPHQEELSVQERFRMLHLAIRQPDAPPVVAFLRRADRNLIQQAVAAGAYDVFVETSPLEELCIVLRRAVQFRQLTRVVAYLERPQQDQQIYALGQRLAPILEQAFRVADTAVTVLLTGESGTGKELIAKLIHQRSRRAARPFIGFSCASVPETLIESELFGHERGAFTGASQARSGRFESAQDGTIFLDEIGELPLPMQVKLLRVLQERSFERLGSVQSRPLRARVICATNRNLKDMVANGNFRLDLYYRLNTVELQLPALRERPEDIVKLAQVFLNDFAERHEVTARRLSTVVMAVLSEYDWPGNVRELQNVIEHSVLMCDTSEVRLEHLPPYLSKIGAEVTDKFEDEVRRFKRRLIHRALEKSHNNKVEAARSLGIARSSLHRLIDELDIAKQTDTTSDRLHFDA